MKVIKIGGSAIKNKFSFDCVKSAIEALNGKKAIIVISAIGSSTRNLEQAAKLAEKGFESKAIEIVEELFLNYKNLAEAIILDISKLEKALSIINIRKNKLLGLLKGVRITGELTFRALDSILSFGEYSAFAIFEFFFRDNGYNFLAVDSADFLITDSSYGSAKPIYEITKERINSMLKPALAEFDFLLVPGFVAQDENGDTTTMGKESSNLTAAIIADILKIDSIEFLTETDGIRSGDPNIIENTSQIGSIDYSQAKKYSFLGLRLIYPQMIEYAERRNIALQFKSLYDSNGASSIVSNRASNKKPIILIQEEPLYGNISSKFLNLKLDYKALVSACGIDRKNSIEILLATKEFDYDYLFIENENAFFAVIEKKRANELARLFHAIICER